MHNTNFKQDALVYIKIGGMKTQYCFLDYLKIIIFLYKMQCKSDQVMKIKYAYIIFNFYKGSQKRRIQKGCFGELNQVMKIIQNENNSKRLNINILAMVQYPLIVKLYYAFQTKYKLYLVIDFIKRRRII
ncbi:unnamed protein product [Paramecium sonneborni]|uniref:Uncharacterized protein n=1 Tax=Paramecium sonneborni TaxID=65129 RepID=A0A8S1RI23_9CILI|nr:unnamed protein product [Paramecium sonneborni]